MQKEKLVINSSYYDEHKKELQLYVGNAIYCTISCDKEPSEEEIENVILDIEWEENNP
jgi:hypothetical protein